MKKKNKTDDIKYRFEIESVDPISPHNEALYEMGKEMLKSSITTVRDFCKFMINISMGVIPIYLGVLKLVLPKNITLSPTELLSFMISPLLFIISAIIFTWGYFPQIDYFSLDIIDEIKRAYEETVKRRRILIICGTALFIIGIAHAILITIVHIIE